VKEKKKKRLKGRFKLRRMLTICTKRDRLKQPEESKFHIEPIKLELERRKRRRRRRKVDHSNIKILPIHYYIHYYDSLLIEFSLGFFYLFVKQVFIFLSNLVLEVFCHND